ncbi:MAG: 5-(carboxyamino)imidazole ribonucleotide synthase [Planctomycetaceae bacterium]
MSRVFLPGSTIGVLGSGQLGRMFAMAARRLGYRVHVYSPDDDTPTGQVADVEVQAEYDDLEAIKAFAGQVDVVSFEFENIPTETVNFVDRFVPVRPGGQVLHTTQQRLREKTFLQSSGFPVTPYRTIRSTADLDDVSAADMPGILKSTAWGYDGKGQVKVGSLSEMQSAWQALDCGEAVLERFVDFEKELSVVAVRGQDGSIVTYDPIENVHRNHILDLSISPATLPRRVADDAVDIARGILTDLDVVGVMCIEFFLSKDGNLLVNELAPRPHNSGHLTIDAHTTCQFEQQVRAVCGLPLGSVNQLRPAAMANLLGDLWQNGEPNWSAALATADVKLHLYGKKAARFGRKMGHLTALAESTQEAALQAQKARKALVEQNSPEPKGCLESSPLTISS